MEKSRTVWKIDVAEVTILGAARGRGWVGGSEEGTVRERGAASSRNNCVPFV